MVGFEYITPELLENANKNISIEMQTQATRYLREMGIMFTPMFIIDPGFDREDFNNLNNHAKEQKYFGPEFTILTPLPGSRLYNEQKDKIIIHDWDLFDGFHAVVKTKLPSEEFYRLFWDMTHGFGISIFKKISVLIRYLSSIFLQ